MKSSINERRKLDSLLSIACSAWSDWEDIISNHPTDKGFRSREQRIHLLTWFASNRKAKGPESGSRTDVEPTLIIEPNALSIETDK